MSMYHKVPGSGLFDSIMHFVFPELISQRHDTANLINELRWASGRPGSRWHDIKENRDDVVDKLNDGDDVDHEHQGVPHPDHPQAFEECLTTWEHDAYLQYQKKQPDSVYSMNQNPNSRATYAKGQVGGCIT